MVFRRISTGCDECRLRHTKCDGATPSCGRCLRRNIACPGYRHVGGFVFKDHSDGGPVVKNRQSRQKAKNELSYRCNLGVKSPDHFVAFFVNKYLFNERSDDASCGLLVNTLTACRKAHPSSALLQTIVTLGATTFIMSQYLTSTDFSWYYELRLNTIKSIQSDLRCPERRMHNDTLLAVLLLDFTDLITRTHMGSRIELSHHSGILTLLELRGRSNFETDQATLLYHAARCAILRSKARSPAADATLHNLHLLAKEYEISQAPQIRLLDLLSRVAELQDAIGTAMLQRLTLTHLCGIFIEVQESLDSWFTSLPIKWLPRNGVIGGPNESNVGVQVEDYKSLDIAAMINQWRCANLNMIRLRQALGDASLDYLPRATLNTNQILEDIYRAIPAFLGLLHSRDSVKQDPVNGVWTDVCDHSMLLGTERFAGDHLGKWFLSDLLERLKQVIGTEDDTIPPLRVTSQTMLFLSEQRHALSKMSTPAAQLARVFTEYVDYA